MTSFLAICNFNSISYKDIFKPIQNNVMWFGASHRGMDFILPDGTLKNVNACWITNIHHSKVRRPIELTRTYNEKDYHRYDNYDAIEVARTKDIPMDYDGIMGVPISFLDVYCPDQFEIIGCAEGPSGMELGLKPFPRELKKINPCIRDGTLYYMDNGRLVRPYARLLIRNKTPLHNSGRVV